MLGFGDGSIGTIHYFANGHKAFPKERLEVFCAGRIVQLDNFRKLSGWGWPGFSGMRLWRQDKGQQACVEAFVGAIGGNQPSAVAIPFEEIIEVSRVAIEATALARQTAYANGTDGAVNPRPMGCRFRRRRWYRLGSNPGR
jgi:hypothetical protein